MVIGKTYFDIKANIDYDICYYDIMARISELVVIKFTCWQGSLEDVLEEVPKAIPARDFRRQLQISRIRINFDNYRFPNIFKLKGSRPAKI